MNVKELEARSGMTRANIRYYEQEGLLTPARKENRYRDYSEEDLETLLRIKLLRRLGFSLDEIRRLRAGELDFAETMRSRSAALEREEQTMHAASLLCSAMAQEVESYSALRPEPYLERMEHPQPVEQADVAATHPWRRFFARATDLALVGLLVSFVQYVVLRCVPSDSRWVDFLTDLIGWGLLIFIEPLLLSRFGTTAGKWCMGITLTRPDGERLSYGEALSRTAMVWVYGVGLAIPLVEAVCTLLCYWRYEKRGEALEWETGSVEHFSERSDGKMAGLYLASMAATTALTLLMVTSTLLPPCRGELSLAQFAENYNYYSRLFGSDGQWQMDDAGEWTEHREENAQYVYVGGDWEPTPFTYTLEDGVVRAVHWAYDKEVRQSVSTETTRNISAGLGDTRVAFWALAAAQPGTNLFNVRKLAQQTTTEDWSGDKSYSQSWRGVSMDYTADVQGEFFYVGDYFWLTDGESGRVSLRFDARVGG